MKRGLGLFVFGLILFRFFFCHPTQAQTWKELFDQADSLRKVALYDSAIVVGKMALEKAKEEFGEEDTTVASVLNRIGAYYLDRANYTEAENILKQALTIREKTLGPEHPDVANTLSNLGNLYLDQGKYTEAEPLYKRALSIREKALGPEHPDVARSLNNLGSLYLGQGKYAEAEALFKRALATREKALGPEHPDVANSLNDLGNFYSDQGKYAEAEPLFKRALAIYEKTLGPEHPYTAVVFHDLALLFKDKKQFVEAKEAQKRAFTIRRQSFRDNSSVLSERDALTYSKFMRDEANQYISILLDSKDTSLHCQKEIASVVFSTKGQVSDGIFARHRTETSYTDTSLKALADSLRYARFKLANLYVKGPDEKDVEGYRTKLQEASQTKERLEGELARRSTEFRKELELWDIDVNKVSNSLPPKSVLVEYLKYDRLKVKDQTEPHYLVIVLDREGGILVGDLGPSEGIDSLVASYRSHFQEISKRGGSVFSRDLEDYKAIATKLYEKIWKPVEDKLGKVELVFVAPDGELDLVSFAGLPDREGKYLIEDYPLQYLASARDMVRLKDTVQPNKGLFALGDPDFDASAQVRLSSTPLYAQAQSDISAYTLRNIRSGCDELNSITVLPLPGTKRELENISSAWKKKTKEGALVFLGPNASEENFKLNASKKKVIHLATHGYYAQGYCQREVPKERSRTESFVGENPLLLSGLFLAGANLHGEGADSLGAQDGILTAEEVTGMNLAGTKWVVLSACESGLGEVKSGEGVYGLRRAFQMAGARTIISALWPISDKTTSEMMSYLYDYQEKSLPLAMQSLSKNKLQELRKRHQPDHPYFWAPFVAIGDWR
jgi:CHAT domain-containing protein/tetratricopeptide (TPR) repeat protein